MEKIKKEIQLAVDAYKSGDLLVMQPRCQSEWVHSVPIRKKVFEARINLTFRCYKPQVKND